MLRKLTSFPDVAKLLYYLDRNQCLVFFAAQNDWTSRYSQEPPAAAHVKIYLIVKLVVLADPTGSVHKERRTNALLSALSISF